MVPTLLIGPGTTLSLFLIIAAVARTPRYLTLNTQTSSRDETSITAPFQRALPPWLLQFQRHTSPIALHGQQYFVIVSWTHFHNQNHPENDSGPASWDKTPATRGPE